MDGRVLDMRVVSSCCSSLQDSTEQRIQLCPAWLYHPEDNLQQKCFGTLARRPNQRRIQKPIGTNSMAEHFHHAGSSPSGQPYGFNFRRSGSIRSEGRLNLQGPLDVAGSVRGRSLTFNGEFIVSDRIEAYGGIDINGNMTCE